MQTHAFEYFRPSTVAQAVDLLRKHGGKARVLAGGQSLIPVMKLRLANPAVLVDIGRIPGLGGIREDRDGLRIGATTRHREIAEAKAVRNHYALLADVPAVLGDPEVRNVGTIGGALAHADPAGDWGAALLAFDTKVVAKGPKGTRTIPIDGFFTGTFTTALKPAEVLTEIRIAKPGPRSGGAFKKLKRKTGDFATVAAAAQVQLDGRGAVSTARIGLGAVGPTSLRARRAEQHLLGKTPTAGLTAEAARLAAEDAKPTADLRGSDEFKRAMVEVYVRRALEMAFERVRG